MNLSNRLATLEAAGLIHPVVSGAQVEYRFRHALVHEAAYSTLLKQDRRELHHAVGEVLDGALGHDSEEMAPVLAFHFNEAGDAARASHYFGVAGANAARKYAHLEAVSYYSQAIRCAPRPTPALFQARGQVYELQGSFDAARLDFERSVELARSAGDLTGEWQALLSLGLLWSGRDYERCGQYCQMAFELAEKIGQPALVARSYNRLGNWQLNIERPLEAVHAHDQALSIFQFLHDDAGIAETLDLLGMANMLGGNLPRGARYYQEAIELNRRLGDRQGLTNVLGAQLLTGDGGYQSQTLRPSLLAHTDLTAQGEQAVRMAREIGWRDEEAFLNMILSIYGQGRGDYALALRAGQAGLEIATEIGHRQWMAGLQYSLGLAYFDFLAWPQAIVLLEKGLGISREIGSRHWTRCHVGLLAIAYMECGALGEAATLLATADDIRQPPQSIGERLVTFGRAHMARARGEREAALECAQILIAALGPSLPGEPEAVPLLYLLRGELQADLGRFAAAEADYRAALEAAIQYGERPLVWRLHRALGRLLARQELPAEAAREFELGRAVINELAAGVPEAALRDSFRLRSGLFSES